MRTDPSIRLVAARKALACHSPPAGGGGTVGPINLDCSRARTHGAGGIHPVLIAHHLHTSRKVRLSASRVVSDRAGWNSRAWAAV